MKIQRTKFRKTHVIICTTRCNYSYVTFGCVCRNGCAKAHLSINKYGKRFGTAVEIVIFLDAHFFLHMHTRTYIFFIALFSFARNSICKATRTQPMKVKTISIFTVSHFFRFQIDGFLWIFMDCEMLWRCHFDW